MTDRRAFLGGICLAIGGAPLFLSYGFRSVGYLGLGLVVAGALVSFAATRV